MNAENGKEMEADMNIVAKLQLGKKEIIWKVCIAPIRDDILIGIDLLKEVDGIIMAKQGDLLINNELIPGRYRTENDCQISRVTAEMEPTLDTLKPMDETDVYGGVESLKESIVDVLDPASLQDNNNTGSVLVETRLQDNLEKDNVSDMDEVSAIGSNVPHEPRTQAPDSGGFENKNIKLSQEFVVEISDAYDAANDDKSDSSKKENSLFEDYIICSLEQTIQSLDSGKNSTKQDDESEQKEIISRDSGTLSPVSSGSKTHANVTKKIGSLNDALNPKISPKMDDSSDSSESRTQAPDLPGNHQMTKEKHPPKISRYGRKINQPLRFKD